MPASIVIGDRGICSLPPECTLSGGSGNVADPLRYTCATPVTLNGCTLPGQRFFVAAGSVNLDDTFFSIITVPSQPALPVPLPLVAGGSALAVALWAVLRRVNPDSAAG